MVFLAALATLAGATYLTSQMFAQGPGGPVGGTMGNKVGLINMAAVLKGYNKFSVYNNEIEKIRVLNGRRQRRNKGKKASRNWHGPSTTTPKITKMSAPRKATSR
jgi:hypothetical protein